MVTNKCWKIQQRFKSGNKTFEDEKFLTGGEKFKSFKNAQKNKKALGRMSSSIQYKVVKCRK